MIMKFWKKMSRTTWIKLNKCEELFCVRWSPDSLRISTKWEYKSECHLTAVWSSGRSQVIFTCCFFINNRWATISSYMSLPFPQKQKDEVEHWGEKKVRERSMGGNNWIRFLNYAYINKVGELPKSSLFWYEWEEKFID